MNPFDLFGRKPQTFTGQMKQPTAVQLKKVEEMQAEFNRLAALPGAVVIHDCVEIPAALSPYTAKMLTGEKVEAKVEPLAVGPFSRRQVIQYPFLRSLAVDIERVIEKETWHFSKFTYQGWKDIYDDENEVIRKEKQGDIIGLIWYAHGNWQPVMDTDTLANIHYHISEFYTGSTSEFWWGVEQGFDYRPEVKDTPGYDIGETLRLHFHKELNNGKD